MLGLIHSTAMLLNIAEALYEGKFTGFHNSASIAMT
jgi:hypothetical protein